MRKKIDFMCPICYTVKQVNRFISFLKGKFVGRPRILRLGNGGSIHFKGLDPLFVDRVIYDIERGRTGVERPKVPEPALPDELIDNQLPHIAVAISKNKDGQFELVEVQYNSETKKARVAKVSNFGNQKDVALSDLRMKVFKLFEREN